MNKIIIGDSHAQTLCDAVYQIYHEKNNNQICPDIQVDEPGRTAYTLNYDNLDIPDTTNKIIVVNFGENDIRNYLPKYDNAEEVVDIYVKKTKNKFLNNRIIFIEPVPQSIKEANGAAGYSIEKRLEQQEKFYNALSRKDIEIVKISEIIKTDRLTEKETNDNCHLNNNLARKVAQHINDLVEK
jgi:hypothetical protein